jgi:predicted glycoside hydrolase/deacetylase ChbG (UPF0249 family)
MIADDRMASAKQMREAGVMERPVPDRDRGDTVGLPRVRLVITADDLGIDPRRDDGIFAAHAAGAITQASLMVGGPSAGEAARRARKAGLTLGLHLDLSEMPPLAPRERIPTLLDGRGEKLGKHGLRLALARGSVELAHVILEAEAQLDAFAALTGRCVRHVDGHQHTHCVPEVAEVLAPVFERRGVRSTRAPQPAAACVADPDASRIYEKMCRDAARARASYAGVGVRSTHGFLALDMMGAGSDPSRLRELVTTHTFGTSVELACHVGFVGIGGDDFNRSADRERELQILCARPFAPLVDRGVVELVNFDELFHGGGLC